MRWTARTTTATTGAAAGLGLVAAALVLWFASPRPGFTVDSGEYLAVAESLAAGDGFEMPYLSYDEPYPEAGNLDDPVPMTQFPPLYPAVLGALDAVPGTGDALAVSRWLHAGLFGALVALAVAALTRATGSVAAGGLAGLLLLAPDVVTAHAMAWSEPLMLAGLLGSAVALATYVRNGSRRALVVASVAAAAAALSRYVGLAAPAAGVAVLLLASGVRGWRRAVLFGAAGVAPVALWFARNSLLIGAPSEKPLAWHPPGGAAWSDAGRTVVDWAMPDGPLAGAVLAAVVGVVVAAVWAWRRDRPAVPPLAWVAAVSALASAVVVVGSRTVIDHNIPFDARLLLPVHVMLVVTVVAGVHAASRRRFALRAAGAVVGVLVAGASLVSTVRDGDGFSASETAGYSAARWQESEGLAFVDRLPDDVTVVTNAPDAVWHLLGRRPLFLPLRTNLYTGEPNERFGDQLADLRTELRGGRAVVVFFERPTRGTPRRVPQIVVERLGLRAPTRLADATAFEIGDLPQRTEDPLCRNRFYWAGDDAREAKGSACGLGGWWQRR